MRAGEQGERRDWSAVLADMRAEEETGETGGQCWQDVRAEEQGAR
jgi:hypothetical protein